MVPVSPTDHEISVIGEVTGQVERGEREEEEEEKKMASTKRRNALSCPTIGQTNKRAMRRKAECEL